MICLIFNTTSFFLANRLIQTNTMKLSNTPIDFNEVDTVVYHLPDGPTLKLDISDAQDFLELELEQGYYCDTSAIDGTIHFFPRGNA